MRSSAWALLLTLALFPALPAHAAPCLNALQPGCRFTVSGKTGPLLKTVDPNVLEARVKQAAAGVDGKSLAQHAINRGAISQATLPMPATEAALNALLARVKSKWPHGDIGPIRILLVGSTAYGARAQPDQTILIPVGLLQQASSDEEVAWVVGHEYGHLALRHYANTAELIRRKRGLERMVSMSQTGAELAGRLQQITSLAGASPVPNLAVLQRHGASWARAEYLRESLLLSDALATREEEDEADAIGFDLASASGFDADSGSIAALKVAADDAKRQEQRAGAMVQRLQAAGKNMVSDPPIKTIAQVAMSGGVSALQVARSLGGAALSWSSSSVIDYLSDNHRPVPIRIKGVSEYAQAAYPPAGPPPADSQSRWLDAVKRTPEFQAGLQVAVAHDVALAHLEASAPQKALDALRPVMSGRFGSTPLVLNIAAKANEGLGRPDQADALYDRAESGRGQVAAQSLEGFNDHILLLVSRRNLAKADAKVAEAERRFGDHERFLPSMIAIANLRGDAGRVAKLDKECEDTGNDALGLQCDAARRSSTPPPTTGPAAQVAKVRGQIERVQDKGATLIKKALPTKR